MAKLIQKGNKIIVKNECTPQFRKELTILIKALLNEYGLESNREEVNKAFTSILNANVCVLVDNHFLDKQTQKARKK